MSPTDAIAAVRDRRAARFADLERVRMHARLVRERRRRRSTASRRLISDHSPEAWRHTDVASIAGADFEAAPAAQLTAA
jgi:hypothetical protein